MAGQQRDLLAPEPLKASGARDPSPLAARMRPRSLEEFVGQSHLLGSGAVLRRLIERDSVPSMILWGPPGTGKTSLARIIAEATSARFVALSAVSAGVADIRAAVDAADKLRRFSGQNTIVFIDEIHRFNKAQQDAVLPYVEDGTITLIGATTENPGFQVNSALLSRARVFELHALSSDDVRSVVERAVSDAERGVPDAGVVMDAGSVQALVAGAGGDARVALTALEMAWESVAEDPERRVTVDVVRSVLQRPALLYDRDGDMHYDVISAFIKSVRGSDADAAIYWLARMLEAGEDPLFIARRLVILAAEDIGLADPGALSLAVACQQAVHFIGMPEGRLPLAECTIYLAKAPKSNSAYVAYGAASQDVRSTLNEPVPLHLRNAATDLDRELGHGRDYLYPHDYDGHHVAQTYLPAGLAGRQYYRPAATDCKTTRSEGAVIAD